MIIHSGDPTDSAGMGGWNLPQLVEELGLTERGGSPTQPPILCLVFQERNYPCFTECPMLTFSRPCRRRIWNPFGWRPCRAENFQLFSPITQQIRTCWREGERGWLIPCDTHITGPKWGVNMELVNIEAMADAILEVHNNKKGVRKKGKAWHDNSLRKTWLGILSRSNSMNWLKPLSPRILHTVLDMTTTEKKQRKRKRFKPKKPKLASRRSKITSQNIPRRWRLVIKCMAVYVRFTTSTRLIEVAYPKNDSRNAWRNRLIAMGAELHGPDSEHRCEDCLKERVENSPFKELKVDGLNEMQANRLRAEAEAWNNALKLPMEDSDESNSWYSDILI